MIFATVGSHGAPFDRLVTKVDDLARQTSEEVFIQSGTSSVPLTSAISARYLDQSQYDKTFAAARLIICHAGVGALLKAGSLRKPTICVPRLRRFKEVIDDHQLEICEALAAGTGLRYFTNLAQLSVRDLADAPELILGLEPQNVGKRIASFLSQTR